MVPLIKTLIERLKPPVQDTSDLSVIIENIHQNFEKIITDIGDSRDIMPQNAADKSESIMMEMSETNKHFFTQSRMFLENTSDTQLVSEITNLCYDMARVRFFRYYYISMSPYLLFPILSKNKNSK